MEAVLGAGERPSPGHEAAREQTNGTPATGSAAPITIAKRSHPSSRDSTGEVDADPARPTLGRRPSLLPSPTAKRARAASEGQASDAGSGDEDGSDGADEAPIKDLVLRIEFASSFEVKAVVWLMALTLVAGIGVTVFQKIRQREDPLGWYSSTNVRLNIKDNYITGVVCSSITGLLLVVYVLRGLWFRFRRLRWDHRRHRSYWLKVVELSALLVNLAVWTYGNDVRKMEQADCSKRNSTILWTYAVRITMSNILLCMWIIAVRGMTLYRGGPNSLTLWQRVSLSMRKSFVAWRNWLLRVRSSRGSSGGGGGPRAQPRSGWNSVPELAGGAPVAKSEPRLGIMMDVEADAASRSANGTGAGGTGTGVGGAGAPPAAGPPAGPVMGPFMLLAAQAAGISSGGGGGGGGGGKHADAAVRPGSSSGAEGEAAGQGEGSQPDVDEAEVLVEVADGAAGEGQPPKAGRHADGPVPAPAAASLEPPLAPPLPPPPPPPPVPPLPPPPPPPPPPQPHPTVPPPPEPQAMDPSSASPVNRALPAQTSSASNEQQPPVPSPPPTAQQGSAVLPSTSASEPPCPERASPPAPLQPPADASLEPVPLHHAHSPFAGLEVSFNSTMPFAAPAPGPNGSSIQGAAGSAPPVFHIGAGGPGLAVAPSAVARPLKDAVKVAADAADMGGAEVIFLDAPVLEYLSPILWIWLPFQCLIGVFVGFMAADMNTTRLASGCLDWFLNCREVPSQVVALSSLLLAAEVLYVLVYFTMALRAFSYLRSRSYVQYRHLNIYLSVEVRVRGMALLFILANDLVQALDAPGFTLSDTGQHVRCRISIETLLGSWSSFAVNTVLVCLLAWLFAPRSVRNGVPILQATLQRFAWTEADLPLRKARRLAGTPLLHQQEQELSREPMYCFESALKLCYWCEHIYYYDEPGCEMRLPLKQLMALYDLDQLEMIRDEDSDSKVMIAWNYKQCLICFRGTASLKGACVDLKAVLVGCRIGKRVPYYQRKSWLHVSKTARLAAVHHGFQWSWTHNGFSERVLAWVHDFRNQHPHGKIIITGHSLGGAHATLCALDICRTLGSSLHPNHITCYTFGSPRVGNHAFAALYDRVVYDTWNVINGNDMVPLSPKYVGWFVYKHPGHKVIVKRRGDLIVRPTYTENAVARLPCSRSVRHHLLGSYIRSMMAVLRGQTRGKHIEGGVRSLLHMSRYRLPELDLVLRELVSEVQAVALAAIGAAADPDLRPVDRPVAAVVAAGAAGPGGAVVYESMARHGSIRLLMQASHHHPDALPPTVTDLPPTATALPPANTHSHVGFGRSSAYSHATIPAAHSVLHQPQEVLKHLVQRLNLGMELLGFETGLDDGLDAPPLDTGRRSLEMARSAYTPAAGALSRGPQDPATVRAAERLELRAFEQALAHAQAARAHYRKHKHDLKQQHRRELRELKLEQRHAQAVAQAQARRQGARGGRLGQGRPGQRGAAGQEPVGNGVGEGEAGEGEGRGMWRRKVQAVRKSSRGMSAVGAWSRREGGSMGASLRLAAGPLGIAGVPADAFGACGMAAAAATADTGLGADEGANEGERNGPVADVADMRLDSEASGAELQKQEWGAAVEQGQATLLPAGLEGPTRPAGPAPLEVQPSIGDFSADWASAISASASQQLPSDPPSPAGPAAGPFSPGARGAAPGAVSITVDAASPQPAAGSVWGANSGSPAVNAPQQAPQQQQYLDDQPHANTRVHVEAALAAVAVSSGSLAAAREAVSKERLHAARSGAVEAVVPRVAPPPPKQQRRQQEQQESDWEEHGLGAGKRAKGDGRNGGVGDGNGDVEMGLDGKQG